MDDNPDLAFKKLLGIPTEEYGPNVAFYNREFIIGNSHTGGRLELLD